MFLCCVVEFGCRKILTSLTYASTKFDLLKVFGLVKGLVMLFNKSSLNYFFCFQYTFVSSLSVNAFDVIPNPSDFIVVIFLSLDKFDDSCNVHVVLFPMPIERIFPTLIKLQVSVSNIVISNFSFDW